MLSKRSAFAILSLALVASLVDAKQTSRILNETAVFNETVVFNETDHDHDHEMNVMNETDHHEDEMHLMNETDHHENETDHHEDEMHLMNETDHDHEEDLTEAEIMALEAKCTCIESALYCSDAEGLEHCRCEGSEAHCGGEEEHHDEHDEHDDHDEHDEHDDHDEHDEHDDHDEHDEHDDHDDHDEHGQEEHDDHDDHDHASEASMNEDGSKPWGTVIGMSFVINLTTLTGVFLIGGQLGRKMFCKSWKHDPAVGNLWINIIIPMFACGALLATTFFLLLPEALHLIESNFGGDGHDHRRLADAETATTWRWGASIMGGFLIPLVFHAFFPHDHSHDETKTKDETAVEKGDAEESETTEDKAYMTICGCLRLKNVPLFLSFNLGEIFHCLADGFFVGAAYVGCGPSVGNSVVLATVLHEIPNQLAGYMVMVNQNGIHPVTALGINFLLGLATLLGGIIVLLLDLENIAIGAILAVCAGIFLHVAIAEMLSLAQHSIKSKIQLVYMFLAFLAGAISIGLVLLNHEHCGAH